MAQTNTTRKNPPRNGRPPVCRKKAGLAFLFFFITAPLFARDVTITVVDADLGIPLEGAAVLSWDGSSHVADEEGQAVIYVPAGVQVVIQAAYPGYETGRIVIAAAGQHFTAALRLSGMLEGQELVVEAAREGAASEIVTGQSVLIAGRDIAQSAQIGIVEDVMAAIRLLPGVGFAGFFNAQPSIRGGEPGEMTAVMDGFYIANPFHWGGGFSIFDPRMVESARLSHGVFSARYGHTVSGLLEITTRSPSAAETQFEIGANTSAANFSLSLPLAGRGGALFMGRVTYYDPVVSLAQRLSRRVEALDPINSVRVAPYIRSFAVTGNYRLADNLELSATGFFGADGVGATFENETSAAHMDARSDIRFDWRNSIGFFTSALYWSPRADMLARFRLGAGFENSRVDGYFHTAISGRDFSPGFVSRYAFLGPLTGGFARYGHDQRSVFDDTTRRFNAQGRADFDWQLNDSLLVAFGVQEMFSRLSSTGRQQISSESWLADLDAATQDHLFNSIDPGGALTPYMRAELLRVLRVSHPLEYAPNARNFSFSTAGYGLAEFSPPGSRYSAEVGIRLDHFFISGNGFALHSAPAVNPRGHFVFNAFSGAGALQSVDFSVGTGLFSSIHNLVPLAEENFGLSQIRPTRSWTSVFGTRLEFAHGFMLNVEFYYRHVFNRTYIGLNPDLDGNLHVDARFDGQGRVWGADVMLRRMQARFVDGWISYSFNWTRLRDPGGGYGMGISGGGSGAGWYFPQYHRFHNLNLVLNYRPAQRVNIYARLGIASGQPLARRAGAAPESFPVLVYSGGGQSQIIEMFRWLSVRDDANRTSVSIPLDIKVSFFGGPQTGRTRWELYVAVENALALIHTAQGNTTFNQFTGEVNHGSSNAPYAMPIPIPSFGFRMQF